LIARELETSLAGVEWLIGAWLDLAETLEAGNDWSEAEAARSLDLLGRPLMFRDEPSPLEGDQPGRQAARLDLARGEIERLEALRDEAFRPLDAVERRLATEGDLCLLSKPAARILRYERDAWRRYREAMAEVQSTSPAASKVESPAVAAPAEPPARPAAPPVQPTDAPRSTPRVAEVAPVSPPERRSDAGATLPRFAPLSPLAPFKAWAQNEPNLDVNFSIGRACG
jgi:hypothetical protein